MSCGAEMSCCPRTATPGTTREMVSGASMSYVGATGQTMRTVVLERRVRDVGPSSGSTAAFHPNASLCSATTPEMRAEVRPSGSPPRVALPTSGCSVSPATERVSSRLGVPASSPRPLRIRFSSTPATRSAGAESEADAARGTIWNCGEAVRALRERTHAAGTTQRTVSGSISTYDGTSGSEKSRQRASRMAMSRSCSLGKTSAFHPYGPLPSDVSPASRDCRTALSLALVPFMASLHVSSAMVRRSVWRASPTALAVRLQSRKPPST